MQSDRLKYLKLLSKQYPTTSSVCREIINLNAILNLPKGTEYFMSDLHGEFEPFCHLLNNCSGVIREKVDLVFAHESERYRSELCTLIYYPDEKLAAYGDSGKLGYAFYRKTLGDLIELSRFLSSKYTRSKVKKALPPDFGYIIDELLHAQQDEDNNQLVYHEKILDTIIGINNADEFIKALAALIKRLAVDHLHIVGDIYDRGCRADEIMDMLRRYHSLDIEWGNHDILWMGAATGNEACIAAVLFNSIKYNTEQMLEGAYGISLRSLTLFAEKLYPGMEPMKAAFYAISAIMFKLEGALIMRNPEFDMDDRLLLDKIDFNSGTISCRGKVYPFDCSLLPTVGNSPYVLTPAEKAIMEEFAYAFTSGATLNKHIKFLYAKGGMYKLFNDNLLFHGCIPLEESGRMKNVKFGDELLCGKEYLDYCDRRARGAYFGDRKTEDTDFMWYLAFGKNSPLFGRDAKTFERTYLLDATELHREPQNPYYRYTDDETTVKMLLKNFSLTGARSHIINGHTPIKAVKGESPVKANGRLIVIDGGFCKAYQNTTGIAGYTLIYNSHGMRIKSHQPFKSIHDALTNNSDIRSSSDVFETEPSRVMVKDTDNGKTITESITDLSDLLAAYRSGIITVGN